ncbi:hypothetical protein [Legionella tucsonensis]|uniref:hypothetical protein n=1 Tax=Legionella tucsonensis TaxID=40335 RepID=UPI0009FB3FC4|nr:hypothetical protein [Legionella tucsonensis]
MIKKLLLCGILSAATLFSTTTAFAYHHSHHHDYPRFKFFHRHHHHSRWKNAYRWSPPPSVIVENNAPYPRYHQHY